MINPSIRVTSIAQLAALQGVDITLAATSVGLSPILIERVDNGRQGFPKSYARNLAAALGVDEPTLLAAARTVLDDSAYPQSMASVAVTPRPPQPILGESFPTCLTNVTRNQSTVMAPVLTVWCVGQNVGSVGIKAAFGRIDRNSGVVRSPVSTSGVELPTTMTRGPLGLYSIGVPDGRTDPAVVGVDKAGSILFERGVSTIETPYMITCSPMTSSLWVSLETSVVVLDAATGVQTGSFTLTYLGDAYQPFGMLSVGPKMYVCGSRDLGGGSWIGHLFEVDPFTFAVLRVSTGDNLGTCVDVAFDGVDTFYVVSSVVTGGGFFVVPTSSFLSSSRSFSGLELLYDPKWVVCAFGFVFVSERNIGSIPKLIRVTPGNGLQLAATFLSFGGSGYLGKPGFDSLLLWVPNPNDGTVSMVDPNTMAVVMPVVVDGQPWAAIVV